MRIGHGRVALFTLGFGYYYGVLGVVNLEGYQQPLPAIVAIAIYLIAIGWATGHRPGLILPPLPVIFSLLTAVAVPFLSLGVMSNDLAAGYLTWFVAGIATLMAVLAVRGYESMAWLGMGIMIFQVIIWGGAGFFIQSGVLGALMLLVAVQGATRVMRDSKKTSDEFLTWAINVRADKEAQSAVRAAARLRMRNVLDDALPLLQMIEQKKGKLTAGEALPVTIAEATIRDQIRAQGLQFPNLIDAVRRAREKGLEVQLLDDGGMELLSHQETRKISTKLVEALDAQSAGRVVIRSVAGDEWTVTFFASSEETKGPDVFIRF